MNPNVQKEPAVKNHQRLYRTTLQLLFTLIAFNYICLYGNYN